MRSPRWPWLVLTLSLLLPTPTFALTSFVRATASSCDINNNCEFVIGDLAPGSHTDIGRSYQDPGGPDLSYLFLTQAAAVVPDFDSWAVSAQTTGQASIPPAAARSCGSAPARRPRPPSPTV